MLSLIDERKALDMLARYFNVLSHTGYVKRGIVKKFLAYLFLFDFINYTDVFLTEEDYSLINEMMRYLFTNGGCMLPYPTFCTNRAKLMDNNYHGKGGLRITEYGTYEESPEVMLRSMQDIKLRSMAE